jgi:endonuclease YncB( thermonuclease family)
MIWRPFRILGAALLLPSTLAANAHEVVGRVVSIVRGDALTVLGGERQQRKIRLAGSER